MACESHTCRSTSGTPRRRSTHAWQDGESPSPVYARLATVSRSHHEFSANAFPPPHFHQPPPRPRQPSINLIQSHDRPPSQPLARPKKIFAEFFNHRRIYTSSPRFPEICFSVIEKRGGPPLAPRTEKSHFHRIHNPTLIPSDCITLRRDHVPSISVQPTRFRCVRKPPA